MKRTWKMAMATLLLMSGLALAQDHAPAQPSASVQPAESPKSDTNTILGGPDYIIGPEDVLHIAVWKESDLTATLPVRPDGKISLPLLNDVQAAGLTPMQLADSLTEKLKKYVASPRVTVVARASWAWAAAEGDAELIGPDDPTAGVDAEGLRLALRAVFVAAGGTHDDWDEYDRAMASERRTIVFVKTDRVYSNG